MSNCKCICKKEHAYQTVTAHQLLYEDECHEISYRYLRLWYKYDLRKYSHVIFTFRATNDPVEFWYTFFTRKVNLTKRENFLTSNLYRKCYL